MEVVVALAGAPNVGKSTLFNMLVGEHRHVGNWPGKTVEKYEGELVHHGVRIRIVDLPGTYSLGAISEEEVIAREYIVRERPDVVVVVVSAIELERTLYLAVQVLELYDRVVVAVNKMDAARKRGIHINFSKLSRMLGAPVVPISAINREGLHRLVETILDMASGKLKASRLKLDYDGLPYYVRGVAGLLRGCASLEGYPPEWAAMRLIEGDPAMERALRDEGCSTVLEAVEEARRRIEEELGSPPELIAVSARYEFIEKLVSAVVKRSGVAEPELTEALDRVLLDPRLGPPAALAIIFAMLLAIFTVNTGFPLNLLLDAAGLHGMAEAIEENSLAGLLGSAFSMLSAWVGDALAAAGAPQPLVSLIADGIITGVGSVLSFLPLIFLVFIAFSVLEDSGVMARFAVLGHGFAQRIGLTGKALLPLLLGIGCNVPAVIGTRILESDEEKLLASLLAPLIPCQARLVVILVFASAFFDNPLLQAALVASIYLYTGLLIVLLSLLFRRILLKGYEPPEIILELPPYHRPSPRVVWWYAWDHTVHFLKKAGTLILLLSVAVWALTAYGPAGPAETVSQSYAALLGHALTPVTALIGLPDWRIALAFETGFVAKEGLIEAIVLTTGIGDPVAAVRSLGLTLPQVVSFLLAMTLYTPCVATLAAFHEEIRRARYLALLVLYEMAIALVSAAAAYHVLSLIP